MTWNLLQQRWGSPDGQRHQDGKEHIATAGGAQQIAPARQQGWNHHDVVEMQVVKDHSTESRTTSGQLQGILLQTLESPPGHREAQPADREKNNR